MHMFKSPQDAQSYQNELHKCVDNLLNAFKGGDYIQAIAVLDWMKRIVADSSCVIGQVDEKFSCSTCPTFPFHIIKVNIKPGDASTQNDLK